MKRFCAAAAGILLLILLVILPMRTARSDTVTLADAAAREAWLNLRGWQVTEAETSEITLPQSWQTAAGQSWLRLQSAQGLHPEEYAGKKALRVLYNVPDDTRKHLRAELLLCGNVLVGAQIFDAESGLMQAVR